MDVHAHTYITNTVGINLYLSLHSLRRVMWGHEITPVAACFIFLSSSSSSRCQPLLLPLLPHYLSSHPHYCSAYLPMQSCHKVHHKKTMSARLDCASAHITHNLCFISLMLRYLLFMPSAPRSSPSLLQLFSCHKTKVICYPPPHYVCDSSLRPKRARDSKRRVKKVDWWLFLFRDSGWRK